MVLTSRPVVANPTTRRPVPELGAPMLPDELRTAGPEIVRALTGSAYGWQCRLASIIGCSPTSIRRYLAHGRCPSGIELRGAPAAAIRALLGNIRTLRNLAKARAKAKARAATAAPPAAPDADQGEAPRAA